MPTLALELAYNGAPFSGFAKQEERRLLTVQGNLEDALAVLYKRSVPTTCAGRTDAGVHALAQVVSFDLSQAEMDARPLPTLVRSLNALTHEAISVAGVRVAPDGFSARFDCRSREYRYYLSTQSAPPLVMRDFCWHLPGAGLNVEAMNEAAAYLIGEHDFKSFCVSSSAEGKPTCRNLSVCQVEQAEVMGQPLLCVRVVGSSFLHSMVRTIVGTLVAVGKGLREPAWVADVLAACSRDAAGEKAPAQGLFLYKVEYSAFSE